MALLIILGCVFVVVALMVILGERFGDPVSERQQTNYSKIIWILVFLTLFLTIIKQAFV